MNRMTRCAISDATQGVAWEVEQCDTIWGVRSNATKTDTRNATRDATEAMTGYAIWDVTEFAIEVATMNTTMSTTRGVRAMLDE